MERLIEISLFTILSFLVTSSGSFYNDLKNENQLNYQEIKRDTTSLADLLEVDTFNLEIIPPSSGVQFYKGGIVFLSRSNTESKMSSDHLSFGTVEAYYSSVEDSVPGRHKIFSPSFPFSFPCEAMTFNRGYDTIYFTMIGKKEKKEKIYVTKIISNSQNQTRLASEIMPLDFCNDSYNYTHPTLSNDESFLVFASDRNDSFGGMDLYLSRKAGGKWSSPENLGKLTNTAGNEFYPFLDAENNLFFSSDGLPGLGGYDIFSCKYNGTGWDKPIDLSNHINSDKDDIAFTIEKTAGRLAFFTRSQQLGKSEKQLFRVKLKRNVTDSTPLTISYIFNGRPVTESSVTAATSNEAGKPVAAATLKSIPSTVPGEKDENTGNKADVRQNKNPSIAKPVIKPIPDVQREVVVYRIQLIPDENQTKVMELIIDNKTYKLYKYVYKGATRYAIGEFSSLSDATRLQNKCRQSGYPQSFVIAFKNNIRSLDQSLFK